MWELDCKESWTLRNWCFWTVLLEKMLESPLDFKEIKPAKPKANQSWMYIGRTDAEAATPIFWPLDGKSWLIAKDLDAGKEWGQEEKEVTEDKMVDWHHWFNGHEFEQTLGDSEGQGSLVFCSPWGCKELDMTEQLNSNNTFHTLVICKEYLSQSGGGRKLKETITIMWCDPLIWGAWKPETLSNFPWENEEKAILKPSCLESTLVNFIKDIRIFAFH